MGDLENLIAQVQKITIERDQAMSALARVLPMAEAWEEHKFDFVCEHEPGECTCDEEAKACAAIASARKALGRDGKK
jgi:hypothetical protein